MSIRLRIIFISIGLVTVAAISWLLFPKILGLYYQIEGAQQLEAALRAAAEVPELDLTCKALPAEMKNIRPSVDQAVSLLNHALVYNQRNAQAHLNLGRAHCLLGDARQARDHYQVYQQLRPKNPLGHLGFGFASESLGDLTSAAEAWKASGMTTSYFLEAGDEAARQKRTEDALRWYERATWIEPKLALAWLKLGQVYDQIGQSGQAFEAYQTAWDFDPAASTTALAESLAAISDYQSEEKILREALQNYPSSQERLEWWRLLGMALRAQSSWDEAVAAYQQAIQEFPNQSDLHVDLGRAYFERGDGIQAARQEIALAIRLNDQSGDAYYALARLLTRAREFQEADRYFAEAIQRAPQSRWYQLARADAARAAGELERAIALYEMTAEKFPDFANVYYQLALAYRTNNQRDEAIRAIERALELISPPSESYFVRAGEIYRWAGLKEQAVTAYRQALILNPNNQTAIKGLQALGEN